MRKVLCCRFLLLSTVSLTFPVQACYGGQEIEINQDGLGKSLNEVRLSSGFYPLVPTWTLVRGSKTAIRWKDTKRKEKNRMEKKRRSAQVDYLRKHARLIFEDDIDQTPAPLLVPGDLLPLYVPEF